MKGELWCAWLSKQAFNLLRKIREVDLLLRRQRPARERIREVHPELCFWALNGGHPMRYSKREKEGFRERMRLLSKALPGAEEIVKRAMDDYRRKDVGRDDILDALVAAVTGRCHGLFSITSEVPCDACGLPMEMVYPS